MKLSEAIRLGAMVRPQNFGGLHGVRPRWVGLFRGLFAFEKTTCALGAAYEASNVPIGHGVRSADVTEIQPYRGKTIKVKAGEKYTYHGVPPHWPMWIRTACPACSEVTEPLMRLIPHLNDHHKWTREQIADMVERVEAEQQTDIAWAPSEVTVNAAIRL